MALGWRDKEKRRSIGYTPWLLGWALDNMNYCAGIGLFDRVASIFCGRFPMSNSSYANNLNKKVSIT